MTHLVEIRDTDTNPGAFLALAREEDIAILASAVYLRASFPSWESAVDTAADLLARFGFFATVHTLIY